MKVADARLFVEELETGRGRLAQLAERYPELREESQEALTRLCGGDVLPLFRHVQRRHEEDLRDEKIVSLTASPEYALNLARDAPGMVMTSREFIHLAPTVRRYDVPVDRVLLYVPLVMERVSQERAAALNKMKVRTRGGGSMTGAEVIAEVRRRDEHEVVADVSGLVPIDIAFDRHEDVSWALAWLREEVSTGEDAVRVAEAEGRLFVDMREGKFVQSSEKERRHWDALFAQLEEFFTPPTCLDTDPASR